MGCGASSGKHVAVPDGEDGPKKSQASKTVDASKEPIDDFEHVDIKANVEQDLITYAPHLLVCVRQHPWYLSASSWKLTHSNESHLHTNRHILTRSLLALCRKSRRRSDFDTEQRKIGHYYDIGKLLGK
jgi:hypothetical protein